MKKILLTGIVAICFLALATAVYAAGDPTPIATTVTANVDTVFSIAFDNTAANVSYPGATNLTATVDSASNLNYLALHSGTKPDIGVICTSNENTTWYLKAEATGTLAGKLLFYLPQPTVGGALTTGTLATATPGAGQQWPVIPTTKSTLYTSGNDKVNTPNGTYCGMSIGINGGGLAPGTGVTGTVTFTLTQTT